MVAKSIGVIPKSATICGGGAKSPLWRVIVANILNLPIYTVEVEEGPAYGGAILAAVAAWEYPDTETAVQKMIKQKDVTMPEKELVAKYEKGYETFVSLYPALFGRNK